MKNIGKAGPSLTTGPRGYRASNIRHDNNGHLECESPGLIYNRRTWSQKGETRIPGDDV